MIATGKGAPAKAGQTGAADTSENDAPALTAAKPGEKVYILNVNSKVIHTDAGCSALLRMSEKNRLEISEEELEGYISSGYRYCTLCQGGEKG